MTRTRLKYKKVVKYQIITLRENSEVGEVEDCSRLKTGEERKSLHKSIFCRRRGGWFQIISPKNFLKFFSVKSACFFESVFSGINFESNQNFKNDIMSGYDELVLIPEEEIDTSDISENDSQNTETISDHSVTMVGFFDFSEITTFLIG